MNRGRVRSNPCACGALHWAKGFCRSCYNTQRKRGRVGGKGQVVGTAVYPQELVRVNVRGWGVVT